WDKHSDFLEGEASEPDGLASGGVHRPDGEPEHFAAVHQEVGARCRRRPGAWRCGSAQSRSVEGRAATSVRAEDRRYHAPRLGCRLEYHGSGPVTEQDAGGSIRIVDIPGQRVDANHEDTVEHTCRDVLRCDAEGRDEPCACRPGVEGAGRTTELALDQGCLRDE